MKLPEKKYCGAFAVGMLWGGILVFIGGFIFLRHSLLIEYRCAQDFPATIAKLQAKASHMKDWQIQPVACALPTCADGSELRVFKLCHKKYASAMLDNEKSRKVASMIPCSFSIYRKKSDGATYLSRLNVSLIGRIIGGVPGDIFPNKVSPEQELILEDMVYK